MQRSTSLCIRANVEKYNSINKVTSPAVSLYSIKGGEKLEMIRFLDCYRLMMSAKGTIEGNVFLEGG